VKNKAETGIGLTFKKKLFFSIIVFLIFLCTAENFFRIYFHLSGRNIDNYRYFGADAIRQRTFYGNTHPHLAFHLIPGKDAVFKRKAFLIQKPLEIKFHVNSLGFRGKEITVEKPVNTYRIFCLGGSTTFGNISDPFSWPEKLEGMLKKKYPDINFEVINGGVPAYCSSDSLIIFLLRALELNPDAITIMDGINDQHFWGAINFRSDYSHGRIHLEFEKTIFDYLPYFFYKSYIYSWISQRVFAYIGYKNLIEMTDIKQKKTFDKSKGLETLHKNIENIIVVAKHRNIDVLLSSFPFYYDRNITPQVKPHYAAFQSKINDLLRKIASDQEVILVDNAALVAKDISLFTDIFHFTEKGTSVVAQNYLNAIVENELVIKKIKIKNDNNP
jgi:lysophospholipase L1-like esterase